MDNRLKQPLLLLSMHYQEGNSDWYLAGETMALLEINLRQQLTILA